MDENAPPAKRPKYDLTNTFEVVVGKAPSSQRFTLHSNIFTARSGFFKAALKPEWLTDPAKPVDLQHEEPEVFSRYLNCVYCGAEALQIDADAPEDDRDDDVDSGLGPDAFLCSEAEHYARIKEGKESMCNYSRYLQQCYLILIDLYLLADRLQDMETANLVMDNLIRFSTEGRQCFAAEIVRRGYDATVHGNPLRKFMRDECVYETQSSEYMDYHVESAHPDFTRDAMVEFLRLRDENLEEKIENVYSIHDKHMRNADKCHYHQHSETHPRCVPEPRKEREPPAE